MRSRSMLSRKVIIGSLSLLTACDHPQRTVYCRDWTPEQKSAIFERTKPPGPDSPMAMPLDDPMRKVDTDYIRVCRTLIQ